MADGKRGDAGVAPCAPQASVGRGRLLRGAALAALVLWAGAATLGLLRERIGREAAETDLALLAESWSARHATLAAERDEALAEAAEARARFLRAMEENAGREAELLRAAETLRAREVTLAAMRRKLADAVRVRDGALRLGRSLEEELAVLKGDMSLRRGNAEALSETLGSISLTLAETVVRREAAEAAAAAATARVAALEEAIRIESQRRDRLLGRIEEAVAVGLGTMKGRLEVPGVDAEALIEQIRASYTGEGGPLVLATATALPEDGPESLRVMALMSDLERLELMQIAAQKLPLAMPVKDAVRFTSGFGIRTDVRGRRGRMHEGIDLAGPKGTPIYATADGEVVFAGRERGYGNVVKIRHAFGTETVYAHLSAIRVKVGDRVARGDRVGDMGNTGRSTGTHLHYEIRVNGTPVNPLGYMKAATDVL